MNVEYICLQSPLLKENYLSFSVKLLLFIFHLSVHLLSFCRTTLSSTSIIGTKLGTGPFGLSISFPVAVNFAPLAYITDISYTDAYVTCIVHTYVHTYSKANFVGRNASYLLIKLLRHRPTSTPTTAAIGSATATSIAVASPFACTQPHLQLAANLAGVERIVCSTCSSAAGDISLEAQIDPSAGTAGLITQICQIKFCIPAHTQTHIYISGSRRRSVGVPLPSFPCFSPRSVPFCGISRSVSLGPTWLAIKCRQLAAVRLCPLLLHVVHAAVLPATASQAGFRCCMQPAVSSEQQAACNNRDLIIFLLCSCSIL